MIVPRSDEPNETTRLERLALIRQYRQATDPDERAHIWDQLQAALSRGELATARARLAAWFAGLPPAGLETTEAYKRYTDLLSQVLAGTLGPGSDAYTEFMAFVADWDDEYQELQEALATGYTQRSRASAPAVPFPHYDFSFLDTTLVAAGEQRPSNSFLQRAAAIWHADLAYTLQTMLAPGFTKLLIPFTTEAGGLRGSHQVAGEEPGSLRDLLAVTIGPDLAHGLPERYQITVQAERLDATTCRLLVDVSAPGLRDRAAEILVSIGYRSGPDFSATPNEEGTAIFEPLRIEDLDGLTVTINLPTAPPDEAKAE